MDGTRAFILLHVPLPSSTSVIKSELNTESEVTALLAETISTWLSLLA
jgi:hypothetical protein